VEAVLYVFVSEILMKYGQCSPNKVDYNCHSTNGG